MKKQITALLIALLFTFGISAQTYITRNGRVTFFSKAPVENIEAVNNEVTSFLDTKKVKWLLLRSSKVLNLKRL